jgi:hypothetical protein
MLSDFQAQINQRSRKTPPMNSFKIQSLCAVCVTIVAIQSFAVTITFDEILDPGSGTPIPNGYHGLDWDNFWALNTPALGGPNGFQAGTVSSPNVAFNAFGAPAVVSDGTFDLNSAYLTAAWNDDLNVQVIGSLLGVSVYDNTYVLSATAPSLINFNYLGIDSVQFVSFGGTNHGYGGFGSQFAIDNLVVNASSVPDMGSTATLLGLGLSGLGLMRRKLSSVVLSSN